MKLLRHGVAALVLFSLIATMMMGIYTNIKTNYDIPDTQYNLKDGQTTTKPLMQQLSELNIIQGLDRITNAFQAKKLGNLFDILGGLASGGIGLILTVIGVFTFPFEIGSLILQYYNVPTVLINGLGVIMSVYLFFIIVSAYLRGDL